MVALYVHGHFIEPENSCDLVPHMGLRQPGKKVKQRLSNQWLGKGNQLNYIHFFILLWTLFVHLERSFWIWNVEVNCFTSPKCPAAQPTKQRQQHTANYKERQCNPTILIMFKSSSVHVCIFIMFGASLLHTADFYKTIWRSMWMIPHFAITCIWVCNVAGY